MAEIGDLEREQVARCKPLFELEPPPLHSSIEAQLVLLAGHAKIGKQLLNKNALLRQLVK